MNPDHLRVRLKLGDLEFEYEGPADSPYVGRSDHRDAPDFLIDRLLKAYEGYRRISPLEEEPPKT